MAIADFAKFEAAFGDDPYGKSAWVDQGEKGRCFSPQQIADCSDNLDITWLRDTSNHSEVELTEPEAIANHLTNALQDIQSIMEEFTPNGHQL